MTKTKLRVVGIIVGLSANLISGITVGSKDSANGIALQTFSPSDQRVVAAGFSIISNVTQFLATRYTSVGVLDSTFGNFASGVSVTPIGTYAVANAVAIEAPTVGVQAIVAAGYATIGGVNQFALVRYNTNGTEDTTFNGSGIVTTPISGSSGSSIACIAIQPADQKIIAAGSAVINGKSKFVVARYNTNGTLDSSFGTGGITIPLLIGFGCSIYSVTLQADGKIVVAGVADSKFALARYTSSGILDTTFNGSGYVTTPIGLNDKACAVAIQANGNIVAAGLSDNKIALARYLPSGALDLSFNGTGTVTTPIGSYAIALSVLIQPDQKIALTGLFDSQLVIVRYLSTGALDLPFGQQGIATIACPGSASQGNSIGIQANGNLVAGGFIGNNVLIFRVNSDGTADSTYGSNGFVSDPMGDPVPIAFVLVKTPALVWE